MLLKFQPFASKFNPTFWHELADLKVNKYGLDDSAVAVTAFCDLASTVPLLNLDCDSFRVDRSAGARERLFHGKLFNFNTKEDFKAKVKPVFEEQGRQLWHRINAGVDRSSQLCEFLLFTFADLKTFEFTFWLCVPAFIADVPITIASSQGQSECDLNAALIGDIRSYFSLNSDELFCVLKSNPSNCRRIKDWNEGDILCMLDLCGGYADASVISWAARNVLAMFRRRFTQSGIRVILFRDWHPDSKDECRSVMMDINLGDFAADGVPKLVGFEKNSSGKLAPDVANLEHSMNPILYIMFICMSFL